jgi:eukaryotic-like serine/threonine-protein kinase
MINKYQKRKNRLFFLVFSLFILIVNCFVCMLFQINAESILTSNSHNNTLQFQNYNNPYKGIIIQYPINWEKIKGNVTENIITFRSTEANPLNNISTAVGIYVYHLPFKNVSLPIFNKLFIDSLKKNFSIESNITTILNNYSAHEAIVMNNEIGIKGMHIWTIKNDKSYIISYITDIQQFSKYLPIVKEMIKSFEITRG